ncbi:MAG: hypothetical protein ACI8P0_004723 [Planctomycetaceae bacterium]
MCYERPQLWYGCADEEYAAYKAGKCCGSDEHGEQHWRQGQQQGLVADVNAERSKTKVSESDCMFLHVGLLIAAYQIGIARLFSSDDPFNNDPPGFCRTQRKPIASDKKLNGITERSATQMLNFLAVGQPHFHETNRDGILATDVEYAGFLTLIQ